MVTSAVASWSSILARTGNDIAEIRSIDGPEMSLNAVDVSHLTSPNRFKEFIGGMRDGGEVTIEGNFYPGDNLGQIGLRDDLLAATIQDFTITFPVVTGTVWTFKGLVTRFKTGSVLDDKLAFSCSIKVTARPALGVTITTDMTAWAGIEENGLAALVPVPNPYAAATYLYNCVVNTLSTYVAMTCTHATAVIVIHNSFNDTEQIVLTGVQSSQLPLGLADTITDFTITLTMANRAPIRYVIRIVRP
ncbi:MAG: hypothetical protein KAJ19_22320 [Gammaproteobacteria bacterium]|nr:hypothetical protein [Gammaproteobacteria bacterium]